MAGMAMVGSCSLDLTFGVAPTRLEAAYERNAGRKGDDKAQEDVHS